jgi:predicted secreted protein
MAKKDSLQLRVGEEHPIQLDSLLTAGYEWAPQLEGDESVAEVVKEEPPPATGEEAVGASPPEVFKIKALRPGKATVRFAQRRPWETGGDPGDEHVVELDVGE